MRTKDQILQEWVDTAWSRMMQSAKSMGYSPYCKKEKNKVKKDLEKQNGSPIDMITLDKLESDDE